MTLGFLRDRLLAAFGNLEFNEEKHIYRVDGVIYPSVSSKVESHAHKFDEGKWAPIIARRDNLEVNEVKGNWRRTNKEACDLGHKTHDFLEHFDGGQRAKSGHELAGVNYLKKELENYSIVARELRMYSRKFGYAGTMDKLLMHNTTGELVISDYKTNANLFKTYGHLKEPFDYLESNPFNKYQFQLSYYQIMLEEIDLTISGRKLVHLKADGTYKEYPTYNFTQELMDHLCLQ